MKISSLASIAVVTALWINAVAADNPFANPRYFTVPALYGSSNDHDTIAVISYDELPSYRTRTTANIRYVSLYDAPGGIDFAVRDKRTDHILWESTTASVSGNVVKDDTVTIHFSFVPVHIGAYSEWIAPFYKDANGNVVKSSDPVPIAISLDEHGNTIQHKDYRVYFGPTYLASKDSLSFSYKRALRSTKRYRILRADVTVSPNFSGDCESTVEIRVVAPSQDTLKDISYSLL